MKQVQGLPSSFMWEEKRKMDQSGKWVRMRKHDPFRPFCRGNVVWPPSTYSIRFHSQLHLHVECISAMHVCKHTFVQNVQNVELFFPLYFGERFFQLSRNPSTFCIHLCSAAHCSWSISAGYNIA